MYWESVDIQFPVRFSSPKMFYQCSLAFGFSLICETGMSTLFELSRMELYCRPSLVSEREKLQEKPGGAYK